MKMKIKLRFKLFLIMLIVISNTPYVYSQSPTSNLMKYWFYRNRLQYFVVPGLRIGESQIICVRNFTWEHDGKNANYGQHSEYQGAYIGVLATEYYLLKENNQLIDAAKTLNELDMAINAVKVYWDEQAEPFWMEGEPYPPSNGFFIRGNVPCDFLAQDDANGNGHCYTIDGKRHFDLLNKGLSSTNLIGSVPNGHPWYIDYRLDCDEVAPSPNTPFYDYPYQHLDIHPESMSQDEAIYMLQGLSLAALLSDGYCKTIAKELAGKIINYITNLTLDNGLAPYWIFEPDGSMVKWNRGGCTFAYGPGFFASGYKITNDYLSFILLPSLQISQVLIPQGIIWTGAMAGLGNCQSLNAALLAMGDFPPLSIKLNTANYNWDTYYLLLWEVLNNHNLLIQSNQDHLETKALDQLNYGPCEGPYSYLGRYNSDGNDINPTNYVCSGNGWGSSYKWTKEQKYTDYGDWFTGNFSGVDYMLLYNLYHIVTHDVSPYYINYNDRQLSGTLPYKDVNCEIGTDNNIGKFLAFNSITSTQVIDIQTVPPPGYAMNGNVIYKAGDHITLLPGFHAKAGCYFHAYIGDVDCDGGAKSSENDYPDNMITPDYDSLISVPRTPYPVTLVDDTSAIVYTFTLNCPIDTISFKGITGDSVVDTYSYIWYFGNGDTSTLRNPKVLYNTIGTYNLMCIFTDTNNISDTVTLIIEVPDCNDSLRILADTSHHTDNIDLNNYLNSALTYLNVFPNPNNGNMQVNYNIPANTEGVLEIFNTVGNKLHTYPLNGGKNSFSMSLQEGVYFYRATAGNKVIAANKIVVVR